MSNLKIFLIACCAFWVLHSCTVEKRIFRKGYHVEWKKRSSSDDETAASVTGSRQSEASMKAQSAAMSFPTEPENVAENTASASAEEKSDRMINEETVGLPVGTVRNDDTLVKRLAATEDVPMEERVEKYNLVTVCFSLVLFLGSAAALIAAIMIFDVSVSLSLVLLALVGLIALIFFLIMRANNRPDRVLERKEKEAEKERQEQLLLPEERAALARYRKRRAIIFFSVFFTVVIGGIIYNQVS